jgi:hypothetical protein
MTVSAESTARELAKATGLGLAVSISIVVLFSPSLVSLAAWRAMPMQFADLVPVRRAVAVAQQVEDPFVEIRDPLHKIVRWRLLFPVVGYVLHLPPTLVLLLSPVGAILVLSLLIERARGRAIPWLECALLGVVAGATSWFFVATGWLGYFDSWLVLGLLAVSFAPRRWMILSACLLTPWVDERFFLGFPLAMLVRWLDDPRGGTSLRDLARWFPREGITPAVLVLIIATVRLSLIGRSGSDDLGAYWQRVAFLRIPATRLLFGAWEGLRVGWPLAGIAVLMLARRRKSLGAALLAFGVLATTMAGLATANDLSRSATLAIPVIPLGWALARSTEGWRRWRVGWLLAAAALVLPAHHVVSDFVLPINSLPRELRVLADSGLVAGVAWW